MDILSFLCILVSICVCCRHASDPYGTVQGCTSSMCLSMNFAMFIMTLVVLDMERVCNMVCVVLLDLIMYTVVDVVGVVVWVKTVF